MKPEEIEKLHNIIIDTSIDYGVIRAHYDVEYNTNYEPVCAYCSTESPFTLYDYTCIDYTRYCDKHTFTYGLFELFADDSNKIAIQATDLTIEQTQEIIDRNTVYFAKAKEYFEQKQILTELGAL